MLTIRNTEAIRQIEAAIGYTFRDKRLLVQVLTRKTYLKIDPEAPDNEVLEFYGDTLMNYHVTNYFMSKYAHMLDDGLFFMRTVEQFTDLRSHYVCNRYLTDRVKAMGLARYLRAQHRDAELRRDSEKAYADIFESLVGAIYLDSYQNDTLIRAFILRQLGIEPRRLPADIEAFDYDTLTAPVDASPAPAAIEAEDVTALPAVEETIPPQPVDIPAVESVAEAEEALSAPEALAVKSLPAEPATENRTAEPAPETAVAVVTPPAPPAVISKQDKLAALCLSLGYETPVYGETPPNAPNARPVAACTLKYKDAKGKLVKISLNDSGKTLAEATEKAAGKMLVKLEKQVADAAKRVKQDEPDKPKKQLKKENETAPAETPAAVETPALVETPVVAEAPIVETAPDAPKTAPAAEDMPPAEAEATVEATVAEVVETAPIAVETPAEDGAAPAEEVPVAMPVEAPAVEAPAETVEAVRAETAEDPKPARKASAKKRASAKKKSAPTADADKTATAPSIEAKPEAAEEQPAEAVAETVTDTVAEAPTETVPAVAETAGPAEDTPAETTPAEEAPTAPKTVRKTPSKKKVPAKKKAAATEEAPAEVEAVAEAVKAEEKPAEDVKPAKASKPRARRPQAKKETPADTASETKGE